MLHEIHLSEFLRCYPHGLYTQKCDQKKITSDGLAISETLVNRAYTYSQWRKNRERLLKS